MPTTRSSLRHYADRRSTPDCPLDCPFEWRSIVQLFCRDLKSMMSPYSVVLLGNHTFSHRARNKVTATMYEWPPLSVNETLNEVQSPRTFSSHVKLLEQVYTVHNPIPNPVNAPPQSKGGYTNCLFQVPYSSMDKFR